jgi:hypothetical protein
MASGKPENFSPCDPPTISGFDSNTSESLGNLSQSSGYVGDIIFSKTKRGSDLLMINGFSYTLNKENKMQYYWRCETRSCNATLITTKCLITNKHSICSMGKNDHTHAPSTAEQEVRVFREHVKKRAREEFTPITVLVEEEMRKLNLSKEAQQLLPLPHNMSNL